MRFLRLSGLPVHLYALTERSADLCAKLLAAADLEYTVPYLDGVRLALHEGTIDAAFVQIETQIREQPDTTDRTAALAAIGDLWSMVWRRYGLLDQTVTLGALDNLLVTAQTRACWVAGDGDKV